MVLNSSLIDKLAVSVSTEESGNCEFFIGDNYKTRAYYDSTSLTSYMRFGLIAAVCNNLSTYIKRNVCE